MQKAAPIANEQISAAATTRRDAARCSRPRRMPGSLHWSASFPAARRSGSPSRWPATPGYRRRSPSGPAADARRIGKHDAIAIGDDVVEMLDRRLAQPLGRDRRAAAESRAGRSCRRRSPAKPWHGAQIDVEALPAVLQQRQRHRRRRVRQLVVARDGAGRRQQPDSRGRRRTAPVSRAASAGSPARPRHASRHRSPERRGDEREPPHAETSSIVARRPRR